MTVKWDFTTGNPQKKLFTLQNKFGQTLVKHLKLIWKQNIWRFPSKCIVYHRTPLPLFDKNENKMGTG